MKKRPGKPGGAARRSASSGRSFSLTDLSHELNQRIEMMSTLSATDLSPRTLAVTTSTYTDPPSTTSTSSNATVVPHLLLRHDEDNIDPRILEALRSQISDPSSLPVEFYGALSQITQQQPQNQQSPLRQNQKQSQTSLNSRQSQVYHSFLKNISTPNHIP